MAECMLELGDEMATSSAMYRLGHGIYSIPEAASYTRVHVNTVRSWFKATSQGRGLFRSDYQPVKNHYAISFLDMIDVWIVGELRSSGVSMQQIRAAHNILRRDLDTSHPFCHSNIYTDGKTVLTNIAKSLGDDELAEVVSRQRWFPKFMIPKLMQIDYGTESHLAYRWRIHEGVVIDPSLSFGKPVIEGTGTTTYVIATQYFANMEDASLVANLYNLTPQDVMAAVEFEIEHARAA